MRAVGILTILYLPYETRFGLPFELKGLNAVNLLFLTAWALIARDRLRTPEPAPLKGPFFFLFLMLTWGLLIGWASDTSQWSDDVTTWKNSIFYPLLYFLFYRATQDKATARVFFVAVLFVAFVVGVQAVRQGMDYGIGAYNETHRAAGPFGPDFRDANRAAAYFEIFVPMFLVVALFADRAWRFRRSWRLAASLAFAAGLAGMFFTYSRQAFFILALLSFLVGLRRGPIVMAIVAAAIGGYDLWVPDSVVERIAMTNTSENVGETKLDESTESRFILWEGAWRLIQEEPLGVGLNHFRRRIGEHVPPVLEGYDAHNNYVRMATEASLLAAFAMVLLLLRLLLLGWQVHRGPGAESKMLGLAYLVAVLGVLTGNLYGSRFFDGDVMGNFWVLTAIVARYRAMNRADEAAASNVAAATSGPPGFVATLPVGHS